MLDRPHDGPDDVPSHGSGDSGDDPSPEDAPYEVITADNDVLDPPDDPTEEVEGDDVPGDDPRPPREVRPPEPDPPSAAPGGLGAPADPAVDRRGRLVLPGGRPDVPIQPGRDAVEPTSAEPRGEGALSMTPYTRATRPREDQPREDRLPEDKPREDRRRDATSPRASGPREVARPVDRPKLDEAVRRHEAIVGGSREWRGRPVDGPFDADQLKATLGGRRLAATVVLGAQIVTYIDTGRSEIIIIPAFSNSERGEEPGRVRRWVFEEVVIGLAKASLVYLTGFPPLALLDLPKDVIGAAFYVISIEDLFGD